MSKTQKVTVTGGGDSALAALIKSAQSKEIGGGIWKPKKDGDSIGGEVVSLREEQGKWGAQTVVALLTKDGAFSVYANASLERQLSDNKVKIGDRIAIAFRGKVKTRKGRPFGVYAVAKATGGKRGK